MLRKVSTFFVGSFSTPSWERSRVVYQSTLRFGVSTSFSLFPSIINKSALGGAWKVVHTCSGAQRQSCLVSSDQLEKLQKRIEVEVRKQQSLSTMSMTSPTEPALGIEPWLEGQVVLILCGLIASGKVCT